MFTNIFQNTDQKQDSQHSVTNNDEKMALTEGNSKDGKKIHGEEGVCCGGCGGE